jgi:hypothetical protein
VQGLVREHGHCCDQQSTCEALTPPGPFRSYQDGNRDLSGQTFCILPHLYSTFSNSIKQLAIRKAGHMSAHQLKPQLLVYTDCFVERAFGGGNNTKVYL